MLIITDSIHIKTAGTYCLGILQSSLQPQVHLSHLQRRTLKPLSGQLCLFLMWPLNTFLKQRNRATRRQPFCLAADPSRCVFGGVQKNSARGQCYLHNPSDIFPCNLIKLFTSLAPNHLDPSNTQSPHYPCLCALIVSNQTNVNFPFRVENSDSKTNKKKHPACLCQAQRCQLHNTFPP